MRGERWLTYGLGLLVGVASFWLAYRWSQLLEPSSLPPEPPRARAAPPQGEPPVEAAASERLAPGAELIQRYRLPSGAEGLPVVGPLPSELVGLDPQGVARLHPDWQIESWAADRLVVVVPCAVQPGEGFVGLQEDHVAVFEGRPGPCSALRELTDIPAGQLARFLLTDLREGIPFRDENELLQIMEGLREGP